MTFTKEELIAFNETMLGRGVPNSEDGIGYNKADYGACVTYFRGLSDAQYADLAKRLTKYCNTQLNVCKDTMKKTAKELAVLSNGSDRVNGISLEVAGDGVMISFRFNEEYINVIKNQSERKYDADSRNWIIPRKHLLKVLKELSDVGADVKNAVEYVKTEGLYIGVKTPSDVVAVIDGKQTFLKFNYNKEIIEGIKNIEKSKRKWNVDKKYWTIDSECVKNLESNLSEVANFIYVGKEV